MERRSSRTTHMSFNSKRTKQNKKSNNRNNNRKPRKKKRPRRRRQGLNAYENMLLNPCTAPLVPGMHADYSGILSRFHETYSFSATGTSCGYVLWCDEYTPLVDSQSPGTTYNRNVFCGVSDSPSAFPALTDTSYAPIGFPSGTVPSGPPYTFTLRDPAERFNRSTTCGDMRIISTCMNMRYIGPLVNVQGEVCKISGMPLTDIFQDFGALGAGVSVDMLFKYGIHINRLGSETVTSRGTDQGEPFYHDDTTSPLINGDASTEAKGLPFITEAAKSRSPTVYGFAWRGLATTSSAYLTFDLTKNVSWRPKVDSGLSQVTPEVTGPTGGWLHSATKSLQNKFGVDWWAMPEASTLHTLATTAGRFFAASQSVGGQQALNFMSG